MSDGSRFLAETSEFLTFTGLGVSPVLAQAGTKKTRQVTLPPLFSGQTVTPWQLGAPPVRVSPDPRAAGPGTGDQLASRAEVWLNKQ